MDLNRMDDVTTQFPAHGDFQINLKLDVTPFALHTPRECPITTSQESEGGTVPYGIPRSHLLGHGWSELREHPCQFEERQLQTCPSEVSVSKCQ